MGSFWLKHCNVPGIAGAALAAEKAEALLIEWLSPAQLTQYESNGYFEVTGSHSGKRYRIRRRGQMNVDELDESGARVACLVF